MIIRSKLLQILCLAGGLIAMHSIKAANPVPASTTPTDGVRELVPQAQRSAADIEIKKMELAEEKLVQELAKKELVVTTTASPDTLAKSVARGAWKVVKGLGVVVVNVGVGVVVVLSCAFFIKLLLDLHYCNFYNYLPPMCWGYLADMVEWQLRFEALREMLLNWW